LALFLNAILLKCRDFTNYMHIDQYAVFFPENLPRLSLSTQPIATMLRIPYRSYMNVWMPHAPNDEARNVLEAAVPTNVEIYYGSIDKDRDRFRVLVAGRPSQEDFDACTRLTHLVAPFAGIPTSTLKMARGRPGLHLHNLHHNSVSAAELAFALLLTAAKQVIPAHEALREGDWRPRTEVSSVTLDGKTALVLGLGAIGRRLARLCRAAGMRILAIRRRPTGSDDAADEVHEADRIDELLPQTDALLVCLPLTNETRGLLDARRLTLLPRKAVLVNIARAEIIDEDALFNALQSNALAAAGLDVWYRYPTSKEERSDTPPSRHDFGGLSNVVLSPHRGGALTAADTELRRMQALAEVLTAIGTGDRVPGLVDLAAGY